VIVATEAEVEVAAPRSAMSVETVRGVAAVVRCRSASEETSEGRAAWVVGEAGSSRA